MKERTNEHIQNTKRSLFQRVARILTHRLFFSVLFLLVQIVVLAMMILVFSQYFTYFYGTCIFLTVLAVIAIIARPSHPDYKIAWIVPIMAFPIFGGLLYLLFGGVRLSQRVRKRMEQLTQLQQNTMGDGKAVLETLPPERESVKIQSQYITRASRYPPHRNTQTWYYPSGETLYARMLEELEKAEHTIFLQYFIIQPGKMWDGMLEILERKAAQGVDVRLLYDDIGCLFTLPKHYARTLREKGIACKVFNPFRPVMSLRLNNRDHRKICVIDSHTAFTGGVNLADEYINEIERFGHWKDSGICLRGAAVWNLTIMFLSTWNAAEMEVEAFEPYRPNVYLPEPVPTDGLVQPFMDSPLDDEEVSATVFENLISRANRYIYLTTPYLIIDHAMNQALCSAAKAGVDVRIITPHIPDKRRVFELTRAHYEPLVKAGVKVYEYLPGFIHSKTLVCDDDLGMVGTINMDYRSLYLHFECGVWLSGTQSVADIKADFLATQAQSKQVTLEEVRNQSRGKRLYRSLLRVFAPLL